MKVTRLGVLVFRFQNLIRPFVPKPSNGQKEGG